MKSVAFCGVMWCSGVLMTLAIQNITGFQALTAVTMKNAVFCDMEPYGFIISQRFGDTYHLYLQGIINNASEEESRTESVNNPLKHFS
jgi:predicted membrane-bound spermidine synthase